MKTIEERARKAWNEKQCGEMPWSFLYGFTKAATEQDRIARADERERCIKLAQDAHCQLCSFFGPDGCIFPNVFPSANCDEREKIRKAIEGGKNEKNNVQRQLRSNSGRAYR